MTEPTDITPGEVIVEPVMGDDRLIDDISSWIRYGVERGWVAEPVCATHDGIPGTPEENEEWEAGHDPCQAVLRLWPDGYLYTDDDSADEAALVTVTDTLEGPVKIETVVESLGIDEDGKALVRNVVYIDGVETEANIQVITALGGVKVIFLDGVQVKEGEVWQDGVLIAKVPGIEALTHQPDPAL